MKITDMFSRISTAANEQASSEQVDTYTLLLQQRKEELQRLISTLRNQRSDSAPMSLYKIHRATAVLAYISLRLEGKKKLEASEHVARYICNKQTSYVARCVRAWADTYINMGVFTEHRQGKHSKRMSMLGDEDIKEKARQWLRSSKPEKRDPIALKTYLEEEVLPARFGTVMSVSVRTIRRHMRQMGL